MNKDEIKTLVNTLALKKANEIVRENQLLKPEKMIDFKPIFKEISIFKKVTLEEIGKLSFAITELGNLLSFLISDNNKTKEDVANLRKRPVGGAAMYHDWQEATTADGSLVGAVDAFNTIYFLPNKANNGTVFLFRNGTLEALSDYSIGSDQQTITYTGFPPQPNDVIQAKYPR